MAHNLFPSLLSNSDLSSSAVQRSRDIISKSSACYLTQTKSIPSIDLETLFYQQFFSSNLPKKWFIIVTDMHCLWIVLVEKKPWWKFTQYTWCVFNIAEAQVSKHPCSCSSAASKPMGFGELTLHKLYWMVEMKPSRFIVYKHITFQLLTKDTYRTFKAKVKSIWEILWRFSKLSHLFSFLYFHPNCNI